MIIFKDVLSGDELISDSYEMKEVMEGFFYEVEGKWVVVGDDDVDIGANPSAEGGEEEIDPNQRRVVDIVDIFRLQESAAYDKKLFMAYIKPWLNDVVEKLPEDKKDEFKTKATPAIKFLLSKLKDLQFFTGESMDAAGTLVYAYYKDGSGEPTFLFPAMALEEMKC